MTTTVSLKRVVSEIDVRAGSARPPLLSVSIHHGVVPRSELTDDLPRADDLTNYKTCARGDLVLNRMRAFQGAIGVSPAAGLVSPDYLVLRSGTEVSSRYLHHAFRSSWFVGEMTSRIRGIGSVELGTVRTPRINAKDLLAIEVPLPSVDDQRRIADFLDDQVTRIDNIIAARGEQERLWNRFLQAEVDAAFEANTVVPVSRLARVLPGWAFPSDGFTADDTDVRLLRGTNVGVGQIRWEDTVYWPQQRRNEASAFALERGDVVVGMDRPWIGEGFRIARISDHDLPCLLLQRVAKLQPGPKVNRDYLFWAYQTSAFRREIEVELSGVSVPHLSGDQILRHRVPFLDLSQQRAVIDHLDRISQSQSAARDCLRRSARLLEELKRSLITAAVTGEFDVPSADGSRVGP